MEESFRFAVIADAHFHDPSADFGFDTSATSGLAIRPLSEISRTMRLFNETADILESVLEDIAHRGIRNVVLLGDYSDDGQPINVVRLRSLLARHTERHGTRFHGLPGNHDVFADSGRNGTRRFLTSRGTITVTSDPSVAERTEGSVRTPGMLRPGYHTALSLLPFAGLQPQPGDILWDTPFGQRPAWQERQLPIRSRSGSVVRHVPDGSYLCEPFPDVWFLFLDANVFRPHDPDERPLHNEDFADCTNEGWTAVVTEKSRLIEWIRDVSDRAESDRKSLIAFSHYPVLNPRSGPAAGIALALSGLRRRLPPDDVGGALAEAGLKLHFGGHIHLSGTSKFERNGSALVDVAVPSLAAYPQAWKLVSVNQRRATIETVEVGQVPVRPELRAAYRAELLRTGDGRLAALVDCETVADLALAHARLLVTRRHLRRDWPRELAERIGSGQPDGLSLDLVQAWYLALAGGRWARKDIGDQVLAEAKRWFGKVPHGGDTDIMSAVAQSLLDWLSLPDEGPLAVAL